jgi:polypeptide N-acetylgalactosaminyltransferase
MVDTPCSRIGHIYKHNPFPDPRGGKDYLSKNFKRVAEVWMDEYKEFLYRRKPDRYDRIDAGDISKQLAIKEKLHCKPFKYFIEVVAPDMLEKYPPDQVEFASGSVSVRIKYS